MNRLERYTSALPVLPPNIKSPRSRCHISPPSPSPSLPDYTTRLSPELLTPIFSYFHPTELGTLALVCRRWRDIVYHTPTLWSCLDVTATLWRPEFFRLVLGRTKTTVELDIALATSSHNHDDFHAEARIVGEYLKALKPYMGRVRRLDFQGAVSAGDLLEVLSSRAPVLRHLSLWPLLLDGDSTSINLPTSILGASPGVLESLTLGWGFDQQSVFPPAFHGLTRLAWYADSLGSATLRAVLRDCPALRKLVLRITHYSSDHLPPTVPVHHLEELTIYQPVTRTLLQDLSHESIPLVSIASSASNDDILSEEPYASWTSLSYHKFDSLSLMMGDPCPPNPSLLHIRYRARGGIDRRTSLLHLLGMDVLRGKYTFDHSSITKLDIQDGCWPTTTALALTLNVKEVGLSLDWVPWLRPLPDSQAQCMIFGKDVPSLKIGGTLPKLERLTIRASFVEGIRIDLPASHLLACLDNRHRNSNLDLVLGEGLRLVGPDSVIRELRQKLTRVGPPTGLVSLPGTETATWWVDNWDKSD